MRISGKMTSESGEIVWNMDFAVRIPVGALSII